MTPKNILIGLIMTLMVFFIRAQGEELVEQHQKIEALMHTAGVHSNLLHAVREATVINSSAIYDMIDIFKPKNSSKIIRLTENNDILKIIRNYSQTVSRPDEE